jgi:hypothetical protein
MMQLIDTVARFLKEEDWRFAMRPDASVLELRFQGDNGQWTCFAKTREEQGQLAFYSICPLNAPEDKRLAMAELLTRANFGLHMGNFELDFEDGEIRFKTSIDVEDDRLSVPLVRSLVYANILTMDKYLPGILKLINRNISPAEAVAEVEA